MSTAGQLIAELQAQGEVDSDGAFTLDREQARQKLQRFQLANPARYVLELVQAAVLKGARSLHFTIDADDMHLRCDGEPFTEADFEHVYGALFLRASERSMQARRHLSLGLCTALALDPAVVRVHSGEPAMGAFLELRPGQADRYGTQPKAEDDGPHRTHVHVRQRLRLQLLKRYFEDREGTLAEELLLRKRCKYARVGIWLDSQPVAGGLALPGTSEPQPFLHGDIVGLLGPLPFRLESPEVARPPTKLGLIKNGVWLETVYAAELLPGYEALVECAALRQDISHERVVQDESYQRVIRSVLAEQLNRLATDCGVLMASAVAISDVAATGLRSLVLLLLQKLGGVAPILQWAGFEPGFFAQPATAAHWPQQVPSAQHLLHYPITASTLGQWVSLRQIVDDVRQFGSLAFSTIASSEPDPKRPLVLYWPEKPGVPEWVFALRCTLVSRTVDIQQAARRRANRDAWLRRGMPATLPGDGYVARAAILGPQIRGELGLAASSLHSGPFPAAGARTSDSARPLARLLLIHKGCLLVEKSVPLPLPDLTIVAEADFSPSELFDDVVGDGALSNAISAVLEGLVGLVEALTRVQLDALHEPVRARMLRGLVGLLLSGAAQAQLRVAAGVDKRLANGERALPIKRSELWRYLQEWPLLPQLVPGLLSLSQVMDYASVYGCVPAVVLARPAPGRSTQEHAQRYRRELADPAYDAARWQRAHVRLPSKARSSTRPELVLSLDSAEFEFNDVLQAHLGPLYADLHEWLTILREDKLARRSPDAFVLEPLPLPPLVAMPEGPQRALPSQCAAWVPLADGAGYLGLLRTADAQRPAHRIVIELVRGDTTLDPQFPLFLPTGDALMAVVDVSKLPPHEGSEVVLAVGRALAAALPVLAAVVTQARVLPREAQRWLLRLASALFPSAAFRRFYDQLCEQAAPTPAEQASAEQQYARLLDLLGQYPVSVIERALALQQPAAALQGSPLSRLSLALAQSVVESDEAILAGTLPWVELVYPGTAQVPAWQRVRRPLAVLAEAPILSSPSGKALPLAALLDELRQHGQVLYAPPDSEASTWWSASRKVVCISDAAVWEALCCVLGESNLLHVSALQASPRAMPPPPPAAAPPLSRPASLPPPAPVAAPPVKSAAETLRELVDLELRQLGEHSGRLLRRVNLARLSVGHSPQPVAVLCDAEQLLINLEHPLCKYAAEHCQSDRALIFFVASAVYTALNAWLLEVTDADEAEFHRLLSARARSLLLRSGKETAALLPS